MTNALKEIRFEIGSPASRIAASDYLVARLPEADLNALLADYQSAQQMAAEIGRLASGSSVDLATEIDAAIRSRSAPADLFRRIADAQAAMAHGDAAADLLNAQVHRFRAELAAFLDRSADDLLDVLVADFAELLSRATSVLGDLDDVRDAETAIAAGKAEPWSEFRSLSQDYAELRSAHLALLRSVDASAFTEGAIATPFAMWGAPTLAWPGYISAAQGSAHVRRGGLDHRGVPAAPFALTNPNDADHWMAVVTQPALRPHVVDADTALAALQEAMRGTAQAPAPARGIGLLKGEQALTSHFAGGVAMPNGYPRTSGSN